MITSQLDNAIMCDSSNTRSSSSSDSKVTCNAEKKLMMLITWNEGIFTEVFNKSWKLKERATASDTLEKSTEVDFKHSFVQVINLIEQNKNKFTNDSDAEINKTFSQINESSFKYGQIENFSKTSQTGVIDPLYLYLIFFQLNWIQNYFTHQRLKVKIEQQFYQYCIVTVIRITTWILHVSTFTPQIAEELNTYNEILALVLNYVNKGLSVSKSSKLDLVTCEILEFLRFYADKTLLVSNLINVRCSEAVLNLCSVIFGWVEIKLHWINRCSEN